MKNIFLIGDSIRHGSYVETLDSKLSPGYGVYVKEKLESAGLANVCSPDENSRWAQYTLRFLHKWAKEVPDPERSTWYTGTTVCGTRCVCSATSR